MKFSYKNFGLTPEGTPSIRPVIDVTLIGTDTVRYEVLVDSGADLCIFDVQLAELIGIDLSRGERVFFSGVMGSPRVAHIVPVTMEVGGKRFKTRVAFTHLPGHAYGVVGQRGFFELFKVTFDYRKEFVELKEQPASHMKKK